MAGTIQATFGLDNTPFLRGMEVAERRAQQAGNRIEQTLGGRMEHTLERAFRRDPGRRAESAIMGGLTNLAQGNIPGAIESIAGKMAGLGIAAGVGIGVAVEVFQTFHEHIEATRKAEEALDDTLSQPLALLVDAGQAEQHIGKVRTQLEELIKRSEETTLFGTVNKQNLLDALQYTYGSGDEGKETLERQQRIAEARRREDEAARGAGRQELVRANVLSGIDDPQRRALAEARMKFMQREAALKLNPDKGSRDRLAALRVEEQEADRVYSDQKSLRDAALESQKRQLAIAVSGLGPEQQKLAILREQVRALDAQIKLTRNPADQAQLQIQRAGKSADLTNTLFEQAKKGLVKPTEADRPELEQRFEEIRLKQAFMKTGTLTPGDQDTAHRLGLEDARIEMVRRSGGFGQVSEADVAKARPGMYGGDEKNAALTKTDLDDVMRKYLGTN